jgi:hypothetical protein
LLHGNATASWQSAGIRVAFAATAFLAVFPWTVGLCGLEENPEVPARDQVAWNFRCGAGPGLLSAAAGGVLGGIVDAVLLAREPVARPGRQDLGGRRPFQLHLAPSVTLTPTLARVGIGGAF